MYDQIHYLKMHENTISCLITGKMEIQKTKIEIAWGWIIST